MNADHRGLRKINNSYESEPSSGSGSSLSDQHDCIVSDEENMHLPYLLKPPSTFVTADDISPSVPTDKFSIYMPSPPHSKPHVEQSKLAQEQRYGIPVHSSQESPFKGFTDSPYGKLQREVYANAQPCSNGNVVFARFYDMIVEENSCNAVDIQLAKDQATLNEERTAEMELKSAVTDTQETNASLELSFNGKIKTLTASQEQQQQLAAAVSKPIAIAEVRTATTETLMLKKYTNERSPDLFCEDSDDEDEENQGQELIAAVVDNLPVLSPVPVVVTEQKPLENVTEVKELTQTTQSKEPLDTSTENKSFTCPTESSFADEQTQQEEPQAGLTQNLYRDNCRREKELLRRIRKCLAGVPPPPSLTIPQLDLLSEVVSNKDRILNFFVEDDTKPGEEDSHSGSVRSLFKPSHSLDEAKILPWREVLGVRQHGFCYNLTRASESSEYLNLSVIERFIGAETTSSYRNGPSSAKKRSTRMKLIAQSPGNRLSHLAKRRSIFSSANLATTSQRAASLLGPQIVLDKKKNKNRRKGTPKRRTPRSITKTARGSTPSSASARKRLFQNDLVAAVKPPGPSRETSKRALFQSPAKQVEQKYSLPKPAPCIKPEIATRVEKSKRALFSPDKLSQQSSSSFSSFAYDNSTQQLDSLLKRKRNFMHDDDEADSTVFSQSNKLFRVSSENLTPRALKIKSQSFCIGAGSSSAASMRASIVAAAATQSNQGLSSSQVASSSREGFGVKLQRAHSDMVAQTNSLTENQRKKLLWAVSQALQEKKITTKHESFKQYAAVLARVVRRIFQEYYQKSSTSNSETLLRLAKRYVYHVINGKNADDIYLHAKTQISQSKSQSSTRLSGYIGPEEYRQLKSSQQTQKEATKTSTLQHFYTDTSMDALSASINQSTSTIISTANTCTGSTTKQPIQANPSLQNSSSKNNLCGFALRENVNVECEERRSAQKNFTGKDQRNISPYAVAASSSRAFGSVGKLPTTPHAVVELNGSAKVKRQITFDN